ncbi:MAG: hypothetical protein K2G55_12345, partial [Lachnospiraceae bacterium]|nr:hypothetical protein [Lachnospiraceae bacterium]
CLSARDYLQVFYVPAHHHVQVLSLLDMAAESFPCFLLGCLSLALVQAQDVVFVIRDPYANLVVRQAPVFLTVILNIYILFADFVVGFVKPYTATEYNAVLVIFKYGKDFKESVF